DLDGCSSCASGKLTGRSGEALAKAERLKRRGRLRCHKRPKSREETPKEGIGGKNLAAPQQYARAAHKKQGGTANFSHDL
ncbi:MAG: hypothetical protein L0Y50_10610, partial [Beijerinckiaceae bacterium]|nr:hypothetical protein [Beijerinckiaceae bacterium]